MNRARAGISDIRVYLPEPTLDLSTLVTERVKENPRLERHLQRACRVTGQRAIRFPSVWEDTSTMAASSAYGVLKENPDLDLSRLRHFAVGTESGVDHSKPVSAYVTGMLQQAGVDIPSRLSSFQVQHACAAGTLAMLSVGSMLAAAGRPGESGIVTCSDIARYDTHSTAEVTQGAGSVSLLMEQDPRLVELDLETTGYYASDVDDFFRPLGSKTARVKGTYSMACYAESLERALDDHCERSATTPPAVLMNTDYFVLHTPFRNLPEHGLTSVLGKHLGMDRDQAQQFLEGKRLTDAVDVVADVGNVYTGALYLSLASLLTRQYAAIGDAIVGKSILMASYGSGNIMVVLTGRIAESAPAVIGRWDLDQILASGRRASFEEYEQWVNGPYLPTGYNHAPLGQGASAPMFSLRTVRDDGYREYAFTPDAVRVHPVAEQVADRAYASA